MQEAANRADRYAYRDRRNRKRQYRPLWIQRIGAARAPERPFLQPVDARAQGRRRRDRSQGARRPGRARMPRAFAQIAAQAKAALAEAAPEAARRRA